MTAEYAALQLGGEVIINAPRRGCHGKIGTVVSLHLATNEATVQVAGGTQHIVPWEQVNPESDTLRVHGTYSRYAANNTKRDACRCDECRAAAATYMREYRARQKRRTS